MRALITDLDNTLYDWVTYFARSFEAMIQELVRQLSLSRQQLIAEFKEVHQRHRNSEHPFAILELPSVIASYPDADRRTLATLFSGALNTFDDTRDLTLCLYPGVLAGLQSLHDAGIILIGHTEAVSHNVGSRLRRLDIEKFFARVYCRQGSTPSHPFRGPAIAPGNTVLRELRADERKPDPQVLLDICRREGLVPADTVFIGDSLARDVRMANLAEVTSIWASYGSKYDRDLWRLLVEITHWTEEEVAREDELRRAGTNAMPTYTVENFETAAQIVLELAK